MHAAPVDLEVAQNSAIRARAARIARVRADGLEFNRYVLRDEENGRTIENAPYHEEWHDLFDHFPRVGIWAHVESAKTNQISIGRSLYEIGRNPNIRIAIVSSIDNQAVKILRSIRSYIASSAELREVFPKLRPGPLWTDKQIIVQRGSSRAKDPTIQVTGSNGKIVGSRLDLVILDDILNIENTRTQLQRDKLRAWYSANIAGRVVARSRIWFVGTAWDPDDLLHWLGKRKRWSTRRYGVLDDLGAPRWPERWPLERIAEAVDDLGGPGSTEVNRQLFVKAVDEGAKRFPEALFTKALEAGDGLDFVDALDPEDFGPGGPLEGAIITTGVDLAAKKKKRAHRVGDAATVLTTVAHYPDGKRQVLMIESGNWTSPEIRSRIIDTHRRYRSVIYVEDNGVQTYLIEMLAEDEEGREIVVFGHHTGTNKWDPVLGVESLAAEMHNERWIFPSENGVPVETELKLLIGEMRRFTGENAEHTGDRLMSLWITTLGGRAGGRDTGVSIEIIRANSPRVKKNTITVEGEELEEEAPELNRDGEIDPTGDEDGRPLIRLS